MDQAMVQVRDGAAIVHPDARRGRGAVSNASGRYEPVQHVTLDDGWGMLDEAPPARKTSVMMDTARTIIARNNSPDIPFDRSINAYRGCEHGCIYCFARPTHAFLGFSPGLDFESRLLAKPDAPALLEKELCNPNYRPQPIAMGTNTDVYQPVEKHYRITRGILEVLNRFNHPVSIVTKSALITRDIDILSDMASRGLAKVYVSVTTLDRGLARRMEPRAATPCRRLQTIHNLTEAGIPTGVMVAPIIPAINDMEIEAILEAAKKAGAQSAGFVMLRLPLEIKTLFREWLVNEFPDRADKVMSLVRDVRGGRDNDAAFHSRMRGQGPYADMIAARFQIAVRRIGFSMSVRKLDVTQFRIPPRPGDQMDLFAS
ncbi:MAG TPA: PA0069 family radical SAM protein [Alphaproteobacteria bacterium]|nr:PA0069 family radical SAM protein [Alphaproteobacteria bacterium]